MHYLSLFVSFLGFASVGFGQPSASSYASSEGPIAKSGVLANIGPSGAKCQGASSGVVVASPSTSNPDYVYTWVRDSSLVFKMLIDQYTTGADTSLRSLIDSFVTAESSLQQTSNPSGTISTGGLGEPKFNIDLSAFTGPWGRPQRDGPALRATAMITYANWLITNSNTTVTWVSNTLWPIIKLDLDYVSLNWNASTFDLWEEIDSSSFWTAAVQHRALREGYTLAQSISQTSSVTSYPTQADNILCFMQSFWNPSASSPYMTANTGGGRSGIDVNTVLASIHTFDPNAGCDANTFQPCSDKALINLYTYVNSFKSIWPINSGVSGTSAIATGRYPEDVYMNGNPWYLATFAVAEQLYDSLKVWGNQGSLTVTSLSKPFFALFDSSISTGTFSSSSSQYNTLTSAIRTYADAYIALAGKHTPSDGGLAEQYDKSTGVPLSAVDLTWSYASAITAFAARDNLNFASWGANGLTVPSSCFSYAGGNGQTVPVTFKVQATTNYGENIYLVGSVNALGSWTAGNALLLSSSNYPTWSITVNLPVNTIVQYKYLRENGGSTTWESDPNNQFTTPASGSLTLDDSWR